jgi:hypothetical protein
VSTRAIQPKAGSTPPGVSVDVTAEVRWFFDGRLPEDVVSWFTLDGTTGLAESRYDTYRLGGPIDIGMKYRFGSILELKRREGAPEPISMGPDEDGWLERWRRWSPADDLVEVGEDTTRVDVDKTVVKRRFDPDGREQPLSEATRAMTGQGCDVEIADVSVDGRAGWTFAFAAFGLADGDRSSIEQAWHTLTEGRPRPQQLRLRPVDSCGYPQWLTTAAGGRGHCGQPGTGEAGHHI